MNLETLRRSTRLWSRTLAIVASADKDGTKQHIMQSAPQIVGGAIWWKLGEGMTGEA